MKAKSISSIPQPPQFESASARAWSIAVVHPFFLAFALASCATSNKPLGAAHQDGQHSNSAGKNNPLVKGGTSKAASQPRNADAWCSSGSALIDERDYDGAINAYQNAIRIDSLHVDSYIYLGIAFALKGDEANARVTWNRIITLKPKDAKVRYNIGVAMEQLGHRQEAIAAYREAVRLDPRYAKAHNNLGAALWRNGDKEEAIRCYEAALAIDPNYDSARRNLENARLGRWRFGVGFPD